jgi:hypothetical protein
MESRCYSFPLQFRRIYEALVALNTSCAIVFLAFSLSRAYIPFAHLEVRVNQLLHIRQTDFVRGHFQFWIPALGLTFCTWLLFVFFLRGQRAERVLEVLVGMIAFFLLPIVWICADQSRVWLLLPPYGPVELVLAASVFLLTWYRNWSIPIWLGVLSATVHYIFWYWLFAGFNAPNWNAPGYGGPVGLLVGFISAVMWFLSQNGNSRSGISGAGATQ